MLRYNEELKQQGDQRRTREKERLAALDQQLLAEQSHRQQERQQRHEAESSFQKQEEAMNQFMWEKEREMERKRDQEREQQAVVRRNFARKTQLW